MAVSDFIKTIEKLTLNLATLDTVSADLTLGQDSDNCVVWTLMARRPAGSDQARRHCLDAFFTTGSPDTITVARSLSATDDLIIEVVVVEFDSAEVTVQAGTFEAINATSDDVTISTLVINDSMVWSWYESTSGSDDADEQEWFVELDSTTNIHFEAQVTSGATISGHFFIATAIGSTKAFSVQHLATTDTADDGSFESQTLGVSVTLSRSIGYGSHSSEEPADDARDYAWDIELLTGSLDWSRGDGATTADGGKILRGWVAEFDEDAGIEVQRGELDYDNNLTDNATVTAVDDIDNSFPMSSTRWGTTQSNSTGNDGRGAASNTLDLTTTTNVLGTVGGTDGTKTAFFQVVETQKADTGITGALAETLDDTALAAAGIVDISGSLSETLDDTAIAASGIVSNIGSVNETLEDTAIAASGIVSNLGALNELLADSGLAASGTVSVIGDVNETLDDTPLAASGVVSNIGALAETLDDTPLSATGEVSNIGSLNETLDDTELSASGLVNVIGSVAETLDDTGLSASGLVSVIASLVETLEDTELSASGIVQSGITGALSEILDDTSLSAAGLVSVIGVLSEILENTNLSASGFVGAQNLTAILRQVARVGLENRSSDVPLENRSSSVPLENRASKVGD